MNRIQLLISFRASQLIVLVLLLVETAWTRLTVPIAKKDSVCCGANSPLEAGMKQNNRAT